MAKFTMGFMGPFSGRLGTAVGYTWNGRWCMRAYQRHVRNPRTEAQQAHRSMFKQEVQLAAHMRGVLVRTMTDLAREAGMTAYNLFVKVNQPAFGYAGGVLEVDYSNLVLSMGGVPGAVAEEVSRSADNVLDVRFARGVGRAFDEVCLYVYVPDLQQGFLSAPVHRRDRRISVALPDEYAGCELHAWLLVRGQEGGWSVSSYCAASEPAGVGPEVTAGVVGRHASGSRHGEPDGLSPVDVSAAPPGRGAEKPKSRQDAG